MDEDHYAGGRQITAPLNYLRWRDLYKVEKPFQIFINIPDDATDKRSTNLEWETHQVNIQDARGSECDFTLDNYGFVFRRYPSDFNCFTDRRLVEDKYFPEIEQILRSELQGLDKIFIFDWRLRRSKHEITQDVIDLNDPTNYLKPSGSVHVDQSPAAVLNRIRLQFPDDAGKLLKGRVRILNVWRPIKYTVEDWPLTLCDGSTLSSSDLVECDHIRRHYQGSTLYLLPNPKQKWYYLSKQHPDEVTIFKNFDSSTKVKATRAAHGSFSYNSSKSGISPRESIEVRALVFGGDD